MNKAEEMLMDRRLFFAEHLSRDAALLRRFVISEHDQNVLVKERALLMFISLYRKYCLQENIAIPCRCPVFACPRHRLPDGELAGEEQFKSQFVPHFTHSLTPPTESFAQFLAEFDKGMSDRHGRRNLFAPARPRLMGRLEPMGVRNCRRSAKALKKDVCQQFNQYYKRILRTFNMSSGSDEEVLIDSDDDGGLDNGGMNDETEAPCTSFTF